MVKLEIKIEKNVIILNQILELLFVWKHLPLNTSNNIIYTLQLEQEFTAYMYFTMSVIYRKQDNHSRSPDQNPLLWDFVLYRRDYLFDSENK
jgi:hypothetical protein